jgi:hypothetical protein
MLGFVGFELFFFSTGCCVREQVCDQVLGYLPASNGVQVPRHHRLHRPGETEFVAGNTSAAEPVKVRRLAEPSGCKVGQKGARLHMHGQRVGGEQNRRTSGRRRTTALVLSAFLAYSTLGAVGAAPALFMVVCAKMSVSIRGQGEPVTVGQSPGYLPASNGVQVPRHHRSHRPGETEFVAGNTSAAEPVRSRTAEGI